MTKADINGARSQEAVKESSMLKQKAMIAGNYERLTSARENGVKVAATHVPGNLNELIMCFDMVLNLPEINAIQNAMRKKSGAFIAEAEKMGHSEDVCSYVKADIGGMAKGHTAPNGKPVPVPDLLMISYTGCITHMKWFECLRDEFGCEAVMMHIPHDGDRKNMRDYVVNQIKSTLIPTLERVSGVKFDIDRLREYLRKSAAAEDDLVWVLHSAKNKPSPIDSYFGAVFYIGPIFTAFRGTDDAIEYYRMLRGEVERRLARSEGPVTPEGDMGEQRYRIVVDGVPNWTHFREFWKMFYDEGAVAVASTYTKVGGIYDFGFRHDPENPLETLAEYCLGCYTNLDFPERVEMIESYVNDYSADGLLVHSVASCNSFGAGQLLIMREVEARTGKPATFIETDHADPRYFSAANVGTRLQSYFEMIDQKRATGAAA